MGAISKKESIGAKLVEVIFSFKTLLSMKSFLKSSFSKFVFIKSLVRFLIFLGFSFEDLILLLKDLYSNSPRFFSGFL